MAPVTSVSRRRPALWLTILAACGQTATPAVPADVAGPGHDAAQTVDVASGIAAPDAAKATDAAASASEPCPANCDDANLCTYDLCNAKNSSCQHLPLPASTTCATDDDACTAQWCDGAGKCVVYSTSECQ